jgi:hypothetical protein
LAAVPVAGIAAIAAFRVVPGIAQMVIQLALRGVHRIQFRRVYRELEDHQPRAGRDHLHAPADAVQQHIQPGQRVFDFEPLVHYLADPGQGAALVLRL